MSEVPASQSHFVPSLVCRSCQVLRRGRLRSACLGSGSSSHHLGGLGCGSAAALCLRSHCRPSLHLGELGCGPVIDSLAELDPGHLLRDLSNQQQVGGLLVAAMRASSAGRGQRRCYLKLPAGAACGWASAVHLQALPLPALAGQPIQLGLLGALASTAATPRLCPLPNFLLHLSKRVARILHFVATCLQPGQGVPHMHKPVAQTPIATHGRPGCARSHGAPIRSPAVAVAVRISSLRSRSHLRVPLHN